MPIDVKKGEKVKWNWKLESENINFTALFKETGKGDKEILKLDRVTQHEFEYVVENAGILELFFDNSFSWINGKTVIGMVTIENA